MSYSISFKCETQYIEIYYNKNFTTAVEIFRLFDDSRINKLTIDDYQFLKDNINFVVKFYFNKTWLYFNPYFLACLAGNEKLILYLSMITENKYNLRLKDKAYIGHNNKISIFQILINYHNFGDYTSKLFKIIELNIREYNLHFDESHIFGEKRLFLRKYSGKRNDNIEMILPLLDPIDYSSSTFWNFIFNIFSVSFEN